VEGPILIIPVKIIRSFSHGITPGIDHVQVQVTVVIKVSPYRRAVIAEGIVQRLLRCLIIDEMPHARSVAEATEDAMILS